MTYLQRKKKALTYNDYNKTKNLFNPNSPKNVMNRILSTRGTLSSSNNGCFVSLIIKVKPNTNYTLEFPKAMIKHTAYCQMSFFSDENGSKWITNDTMSGFAKKIISTPENCYSFRFTGLMEDIDKITFTKS